jgi:hypothetical protein
MSARPAGAGLKMGTEGQGVILSLRVDVSDFRRYPLHRSAVLDPQQRTSLGLHVYCQPYCQRWGIEGK